MVGAPQHGNANVTVYDNHYHSAASLVPRAPHVNDNANTTDNDSHSAARPVHHAVASKLCQKGCRGQIKKLIP